jgi:hypothetical protein
VNPAEIKLFEELFEMFFIMMVVITGFVALYVKFTVRGKVSIVFFETRRIYSMLLKEDTDNKCVWRGAETNPQREKYRLVPEKKFEIMYPGGLPWFLQERVRAWVYARNGDEPFDPENTRSTTSAKMNRMISDEALLRTMWKDLRQSVGLTAGGGPLSMQMLLFLAFIALLSGLGMILSYNLGKELKLIYALLLQVYKLVGGK